MGPTIIEGTWEEVIRRGSELAGHRVRVTVLDERATSTVPHGTPAEQAAEATAFDVLSRAGLIGCLKADQTGSTDVATNPSHMKGFGGE